MIQYKTKRNNRSLFIYGVMLLTLMFIMTACSSGELTEKDLVEKDGLVYEKGSSKPFSGMISEEYPNGNLKYRKRFKDGKYNGSVVEFYENGKKKVESTYDMGKRKELYSEWYDNGQQKVRAFYTKGIRDGAYREYNKDGRIKVDTNFRNGKPIGDN